MIQRFWYCFISIFAAGVLEAQAVLPADPVSLPVAIDSNSATLWYGNSLLIYNSTGSPNVTIIAGDIRTVAVGIDTTDHFPMWIESVWRSPEGRVFAWYHYERVGECPGTTLNIPEIGALVSDDGGMNFHDLGIVLKSGEPKDCSSQNGYFAGGHGDFSVIPDREGRYFYFLFDVYDGDVSEQGVAIARMAVADLEAPVGGVWKYHLGSWTEPGVGGRVTPVFPATVSWQQPDTDSFWGPSVHWNTYLEKYVLLMNRSCCEPGWPQEGVYMSIAGDITDPTSWSKPVKILDPGDWYPWVLGVGPGESSSEAGQIVRLFVRNFSEWAIDFGAEPESGSDGAP